jgi:hypothetical protein
MTDLAIDIHFRLPIHLHVKEGSGVSTCCKAKSRNARHSGKYVTHLPRYHVNLPMPILERYDHNYIVVSTFYN